MMAQHFNPKKMRGGMFIKLPTVLACKKVIEVKSIDKDDFLIKEKEEPERLENERRFDGWQRKKLWKHTRYWD